jgi:hypothetical protein
MSWYNRYAHLTRQDIYLAPTAYNILPLKWKAKITGHRYIIPEAYSLAGEMRHVEITIKYHNECGRVAQVVEYVPSKCEALTSYPSTTKEKWGEGRGGPNNVYTCK